MPLILISCFDPFGGEPTNPSMELCERLPRDLGFATVETLLLPTSFARAPKALLAAGGPSWSKRRALPGPGRGPGPP